MRVFDRASHARRDGQIRSDEAECREGCAEFGGELHGERATHRQPDDADPRVSRAQRARETRLVGEARQLGVDEHVVAELGVDHVARLGEHAGRVVDVEQVAEIGVRGDVETPHAESLVHPQVEVRRPGQHRRVERLGGPAARLAAISELREVGVPVGVMVAPVIPGLTDEEMPQILKESAARGAERAGYIIVRLPGPVKELFLDWLDREFPTRARRVRNRLVPLRAGCRLRPNTGSILRAVPRLRFRSRRAGPQQCR